MVKYSRSFWIFFLLITSVGVMGQVQEDYFDPLTDDITDYLHRLKPCSIQLSEIHLKLNTNS